ncbi:hypothetical protein ALC62_07880 [Cyphomyrmex costatus]|uniref:Uncharacterized protein n=1 Tax=Cyphomyrmex costatus TaxID=456900 RepID=A0A195CKL2_9HYME|nr:hypothetical protein ALC62_07880 [Cyphomyrmex costatus]
MRPRWRHQNSGGVKYQSVKHTGGRHLAYPKKCRGIFLYPRHHCDSYCIISERSKSSLYA